ncbi:MAG: branched-chain amino acid ABC transporter permease [Betaproteobacteria bacterium]|nr:branched-chain amino acid ABC transporter permease [Betaproteobacteria bacterium]
MRHVEWLRWTLLLVVAGAGAVGILTGDLFLQEKVAEVAIFAIFALSVDFLAGYVGLISFGHAGFLGIGAYMLAYLTLLNRWPMGMATLATLAAGTLAALLVALLVVRTRGTVFIMVTLAFSMMFYAWALTNESFKGADGVSGIARIDLSVLGLDLDEPAHFAWFCMIAMLLVFLVLDVLTRSPFGRMLTGIRLNENRMRALGCRVVHYKCAAFAVSGLMATVAGCLGAQHSGFVSPDVAFWTVSGDVLIAIIIGGLGSLTGAVAGAAILIGLKYGLSLITPYWLLALGLVFVAVVMLAPEGLFGRLSRWLGRGRLGARVKP